MERNGRLPWILITCQDSQGRLVEASSFQVTLFRLPIKVSLSILLLPFCDLLFISIFTHVVGMVTVSKAHIVALFHFHIK